MNSNLFKKYMEIFAKLTDCFAGSYLDIEQTREILAKSEIDYLDIEVNGSPRNNWWNIMQYVLTTDLNYIDTLIKISLEDNPKSSCMHTVKNDISNFNKAGATKPKTDNYPHFEGGVYDGKVEIDTKSILDKMGNVHIQKKNRIGSEVDLSGVKNYKHYATKSIQLNNPRGFDQSVEKNVDETNSILTEILKSPHTESTSKKVDKTLLTRAQSSMAVGLIFNAKAQSYCTGFLIAKNVVVLPNFIIGGVDEISSLQFALRNPFQTNKEIYTFQKEPMFYDKDNQTMLLKLNKSVKYVTPLPLAVGDTLKKIKGDDATLIAFSNIHKKITDITDMKVEKDGHEITYTTESSPGSAGGPILIDGYVVGMHVGKGSKGRKRGVNLLRLET